MTEPLAVSIPEATRITSCSRSTLYAEIKSGNLKVHKIGRRTAVTIENLKGWLASKSGEAA